MATLASLGHSAWDLGDAVGMILFQMYLIASTILAHARVSFQLTGKVFVIVTRGPISSSHFAEPTSFVTGNQCHDAVTRIGV